MMLSGFLIQRVTTYAKIEFNKKSITFYKKSFFLFSESINVEVKNIIGIYPYSTSLVKIMKYRKKLRLNSALDNRDVWIIAYKEEKEKKGFFKQLFGKSKKINAIFFKPSLEFLDLIRNSHPSKVKNTEAEVALLEMNEH